MKSNKNLNVPNLRFPEFCGEWIEKRFEDIAKFSKGKGISKLDISENGATECIRYGQLYTDYSEVISQVISKTDIENKDLVLSEENDVIIPASGENQIDIATASCVKKSGVALGGDLNIMKSNENGVFLSYYLNNAKKLHIAKLAQGISVVHLYASQLKNLKLIIPSLDEQKRVSEFLTTLDERISTQNKIIEHQESLMKGLMQQMFTQQLRFKENDGSYYPDWVEKKLGKLFHIGSGRDYKQLQQGNIPVYGTGGYMNSVDNYLYEGESVGIGRKGTIDKPVFLTGKFWTVDTLFYTHSFKDVLPYFVFLLFKQINWLKYNEASGVPSLSKTTIEKIKVKIPVIEEQQKIVKSFYSISTRIENEKQILEQYKQQKQYLLKNLFI
ncbi:restriction endonuclease subunit S [Draconibacterium sediminis]|uniref:restriction endonuclease subunit S n=1 Tax=Draconibacterium sediminis TaxID=1544798 RepID=UPI0026F28E1D|nr:restriction endonuclease subunit S [Draconibacterium sediminis]